MRFIVLVPFSVIVIAALLGAGVVALIGQALSALMEFLFVVLKSLFAAVCFGGGGFLIGVATYRLVRVFTKKLHDRIWPSAYVFWIAVGLLAFGFGFATLFAKSFTRQIPYEHVWESSKWFFWTETHSEVRYRTEQTGWHTLSVACRTGGWWLLLTGLVSLAVEFLVRRRRDIQSAVSSTAKKAKAALDGPTAT